MVVDRHDDDEKAKTQAKVVFSYFHAKKVSCLSAGKKGKGKEGRSFWGSPNHPFDEQRSLFLIQK